MFFIFSDHIMFPIIFYTINIRVRISKASTVELSAILGKVISFSAVHIHNFALLKKKIQYLVDVSVLRTKINIP